MVASSRVDIDDMKAFDDTTAKPASYKRPLTLMLGIGAAWAAWLASLNAWDVGGADLCTYQGSGADPCDPTFNLPAEFWVNYLLGAGLAVVSAVSIVYAVGGRRWRVGLFAKSVIFVLAPAFVVATTHAIDPSRFS